MLSAVRALGLGLVVGRRTGGALFDSRKGRNTLPPTLIWLEDLSHLPDGTGEFDAIALMASDIAFPVVIVNRQVGLQATLVIKVAVARNERSVRGTMWDALGKFDRAWEVTGHRGSL
jgi:hypothetical protein